MQKRIRRKSDVSRRQFMDTGQKLRSRQNRMMMCHGRHGSVGWNAFPIKRQAGLMYRHQVQAEL